MKRNNNYSNTKFHVFVEIVTRNYVLYKLNRYEFARNTYTFSENQKIRNSKLFGQHNSYVMLPCFPKCHSGQYFQRHTLSLGICKRLDIIDSFIWKTVYLTNGIANKRTLKYHVEQF